MKLHELHVLERQAGSPPHAVAVLGARERQTEMLKLIDGSRRLSAEVFDGVLIAQPVGALDRVVHMPAPVVRTHIAERGGDAALGSDGMRAGGEHLGNAGGPES